jgi:hypothetical protein
MSMRTVAIASLLAIPVCFWLARGTGPSEQATYWLGGAFRGLVVVAVGIEVARLATRTHQTMDHLKNEAERLRVGIRGGWLNVEQAVAWADDQIAQSPAPHPAVLDVALARTRSREEVAALLDAVPGTVDGTGVMRRCLADLLAVVEHELYVARAVAKWLEVAAHEGLLPASDFGWEPVALADTFALAEQRVHGTVIDAQERLLSFLREHAQREA